MSKKSRRVRSNPVGALYARQNLRKTALDCKLRIYLTAHGEEAVDLLADLAVILGTCAEAGRMMVGGEAWVKMLHSGLRNIQAMCLDGYRWSAAPAPYLDACLDTVEARMMLIPLPELVVAHSAAHWLGRAVRGRAVTKDMIAGAEAWSPKR